MIVCIDPGHGGKDSGAIGNNLVEKTLTLAISKACGALLQKHGVEVVYTRTTDVYVDLTRRTAIANAAHADYTVSIHINAGGGDGAEAIHSIRKGAGEKLARAIVTAINTRTGQNLRPTSCYSKMGAGGEDYYAMIRQTKMETVITECAFIDHKLDYKIVDTAEKQCAMGEAIAAGILSFLGIPLKAKASEVQKYGLVNATALNVRAAASTSSSVIGRLTKGTRVELIKLEGEWYSIKYNSSTGYVYATYISI